MYLYVCEYISGKGRDILKEFEGVSPFKNIHVRYNLCN